MSACFHCGLPVADMARWTVRIADSDQAMCCPGCQAVARSIVDHGLEDYYATRIGYGTAANGATVVPPELLLVDNPPVTYSTGDVAGDEILGATFSITGIRCAACIWLIERRLHKLPGVIDIELNVAGQRLQVRWSRQTCTPGAILAALRAIGYVAFPFDPVLHGVHLERARKSMFRRLFIAGLMMMQVMMYAFPAYIADAGAMDSGMTGLMRWASLLLSLPALLYSAQPFFKGAWMALQNRLPNMDVPVALGIAAAFIGSVHATITGSGEVYFDSITMFIFLLLCSRYLELLARRKAASALDELQRALPASALLMTAWPASMATTLVAASQLRDGDVVLVRPGDAIAADGIVIDGDTSIDASLLTGESAAQHKAIGASLPGGAVNIAQPVVMRVVRAADRSTLSMLVKLMERAGASRPRQLPWADKVAAWFVSALLLFALLVFVVWHFVDPARAWQIAIAVMVVSCPCALSLAAPAALAATTDRLVRQGALVLQSHVLETLHSATHIVFDKTGTLTLGKPAVRDIAMLSGASRANCIGIAAALEAGSAHPLADAIIRCGQEQDPAATTMATAAIEHLGGRGVQGWVGGALYRLGRAEFVSEIAGAEWPAAGADEVTSVYLGTQQQWLARFDLADGLRADAAALIATLQAQGKTVSILSGDRQAVAQDIASGLKIQAAIGDCSPENKVAYVQALQRQGAIVAMVGDGVNDAAVLRAADVSVAMGGGAALAQLHADCVLWSGKLATLGDVLDAADRTHRVIRQNLAWATLYNLVAIPAAAFGWLNPWMSGAGMALSSAVVVLNALRLRSAGSARRAARASASDTAVVSAPMPAPTPAAMPLEA